MVKICGRCKIGKELIHFHKSKRDKTGHQSWCKECQRDHNRSPEGGRLAYHRNRYHTKKDMYLDATYKRRYGISLQEYEQMSQAQGGVCAICKEECSTGRRLAVDHNHKSGKVRGLLCGNCNKAIGAFQEDPEIIQKAISYVEQHNE